MRLLLALFFCFTSISAEVSRLRVLSEPSGADVYVDGVLSGKTPVEIDASSLRHVRVVRPGYVESILPVRTDSPSEVLFLLKRVDGELPGKTTEPAGSTVTSTGAMWRSMLLPGWGQISKGDSSGYWFGLGSILAAGTYFYYGAESRRALDHVVQRYQLEDVRLIGLGVGATPSQLATASVTAQTGYLGYIIHGSRHVADTLAKSCFPSPVPFPSTISRTACKAYERAQLRQRQAGYAFLGLYAWNVLDALLSNPRVPVAAAPLLGDDRGIVVAGRVRF